MTREEAIEELERLLRHWDLIDEGIYDLSEHDQDAVEMALTALRPVSRERVEKAWFREPYTRLETRSTPEGNRQYIAENICMACGSKTPIGRFCHNCGVALDDWAVEMVMERLEALHDNRT